MTGHDAQNTASTAMALEKRRLLQNFSKEYLCNELRYCFPWQPSGGCVSQPVSLSKSAVKPKPEAAVQAVEHITERLIAIEASQEGVGLWQAFTSDGPQVVE